MKTQIPLFQSLTILLLLIYSMPSSAVKYTVHVGNFYFTPASVTPNVGDTVHWVWDNGGHTTSSVSVPVGALTWSAPIDVSNQSFDYKITVAGTYNYRCNIHTFMTATITATAPPPVITVTSPNGAETWTQGSSHNITWDDNITENVKIDLYKAGSFLLQITPSTPSTGSYSWTIDPGQQTGSDYKVVITSTTSGLVTDASNNNFTISAIPAAVLSLQNITVLNGQTFCYNATQTISVAGSGTSFAIENGGSVTMIAGQNIDYLPGTLVNPGGYLHGYITTNGQYCTSPAAPFISGLGSGSGNQSGESELIYKVYPNPTTGTLKVLLNTGQASSEVVMNVFGTLGNQVIHQTFNTVSMYQLSLSAMPPGIYFVRLTSGTKTETLKIVKL